LNNPNIVFACWVFPVNESQAYWDQLKNTGLDE